MLRILEHGGNVHMVMSEGKTLSVNTPADLERVVSLMAGDRLIHQYWGKQT